MNESENESRNAFIRKQIYRFECVLSEVDSIIRDASYWNGLPHNQEYRPLDIERDRIFRAEVIKAIAQLKGQIR